MPGFHFCTKASWVILRNAVVLRNNGTDKILEVDDVTDDSFLGISKSHILDSMGQSFSLILDSSYSTEICVAPEIHMEWVMQMSVRTLPQTIEYSFGGVNVKVCLKYPSNCEL